MILRRSLLENIYLLQALAFACQSTALMGIYTELTGTW
jgi:hypothetical protein